MWNTTNSKLGGFNEIDQQLFSAPQEKTKRKTPTVTKNQACTTSGQIQTDPLTIWQRELDGKNTYQQASRQGKYISKVSLGKLRPLKTFGRYFIHPCRTRDPSSENNQKSTHVVLLVIHSSSWSFQFPSIPLLI